MNTKIHQYIDDHASEMVDVLSTLVAIPSVIGEANDDMPFGEEPAKALWKMLEISENYGSP